MLTIFSGGALAAHKMATQPLCPVSRLKDAQCNLKQPRSECVGEYPSAVVDGNFVVVGGADTGVNKNVTLCYGMTAPPLLPTCSYMTAWS